MQRSLMLGAALLAAACLAQSGTAQAQQAGLTRTELQKLDFPGSDYVTETFRVTVAPHGVVNRHTHPGVEIGYLLSGTGTLSIEGDPERMVKAGDSWAVPAGKPHALRNTSDEPEQIVVTYVVEKNKPLATPAP